MSGGYQATGGAPGQPFFGGFQMYPSYSSPFGGGYGAPHMSDQMWTGVIGRAAENLGKINNFLTMTGMLLDHVSQHGKLFANRFTEVRSWFEYLAALPFAKVSVIIRVLKQLEASKTSGDVYADSLLSDQERKDRRIKKVRRILVVLLLGLLMALICSMVSSKSRVKALQGVVSSGATMERMWVS